MQRHLLTTLCATAVACLAGASVAEASSIVYVKDGDIYLTSPDGQLGYEVAGGGDWSAPSQADDGTIVAVRGQDIVRLDRSGHILSDVPVVGGSASAAMFGTGSFVGPMDAEVSPDGTRVAYQILYDNTYGSPGSCYGCYGNEMSNLVSVTASDHFTVDGYDDDDATEPHWLPDGSRLLFTDSTVNPQARLWQPGPEGSGQFDGSETQWFGDPPQQLGDPSYFFFNTALSRDGSKVAVIAGGDGSTGPSDHLLLYSANGPAGSAAPTPQCAFATADMTHLSWAPDGSAVAVDDAGGVELIDVPATLSGCDGVGNRRTLIAGGSHPFWGPADVNMAQAPSTPSSTPAGTPAPGSGPGAPVPGGGPTSGSAHGSGHPVAHHPRHRRHRRHKRHHRRHHARPRRHR